MVARILLLTAAIAAVGCGGPEPERQNVKPATVEEQIAKIEANKEMPDHVKKPLIDSLRQQQQNQQQKK